MVKLIVGQRGTGKTKALIQFATQAAKTSKGHVVCVEKGDALRFDLSYHIRLIDAEQYGKLNADAYYGFLAGLLAGNYDITDLFCDATLRIMYGKNPPDLEEFANLIEKIAMLTSDNHTTVTFTVSCDPALLPERIQEYIIQHQ
jgi:hypothetical protein